MKRLMTVFMMICLVVMLCGCMSVDIKMGIDKNYVAYLEYVIDLDGTEMSQETYDALKRSILLLRMSYEELGFICEDIENTLESNRLQFSMRLEKKGESLEEASAFLEEMLTNPEMTPFVNLSMADELQSAEWAFVFHGTIDAEAILKTAHIDYMPGDIKKLFEDGVQKSTVNAELKVPASEIVAGEGEVKDGMAVVDVPVSLEAPTEITLTCRQTIKDGKYVARSIESEIKKEKGWASFFSVMRFVGPALLVLCIVWVVYQNKKKKSTDAEHTEQM